MIITIIGGSGFIGQNITRMLKEKHRIKILDVKKSPITNVDFMTGDINEINSINKATKNSDIVIHLAAALGVINTEKNPIHTLDTNIYGTRNVLESCKKNNVRKIIFSSSSEVYGEPKKIPISENDDVIPITNYGVSKLAAEEYIKAYSREHGIRYTILRLFNVYGNGQGNSWVIPEFINKALKNHKILIHGDGSQVRAFCHVSDVARAFQSALRKGDSEIINVGNNLEPINIKSLAKKIISLSNSKSHIDFIPFEKSKRNRTEIMTRIPQISKAKKILSYEPKTSLEQGLKLLIQKKPSY